MNLLKSAFVSAAALGAGLFAAPETADAQVRVYLGGGNGYGYNSGYGYNGGGWDRGHRHNDGYRNSRGFVGRGGRTWHDTGHYDYHPTTVVPHRGHYHVQPGHYDYHSTGHWDRTRGGHRHDH